MYPELQEDLNWINSLTEGESYSVKKPHSRVLRLIHNGYVELLEVNNNGSLRVKLLNKTERELNQKDLNFILNLTKKILSENAWSTIINFEEQSGLTVRSVTLTPKRFIEDIGQVNQLKVEIEVVPKL